jgi:hypothetical protein
MFELPEFPPRRVAPVFSAATINVALAMTYAARSAAAESHVEQNFSRLFVLQISNDKCVRLHRKFF